MNATGYENRATGYESNRASVARLEPANAERPNQVPLSMKCLEEEILAIGSAVDRITSRLVPVLRISPPAVGASVPQDGGSPAMCPLASFIEERGRSLSRIREMLSDLENRIEL